MNGPRNPLLLIGLGPRAHRVVRDTHDTAASLQPEVGHAQLHLTDPEGKTPLIRRSLQGLLDAGSTAGHARLDVVIVADTPDVDPGDVHTVVGQIDDILKHDFPVLFPPSTPADQRTAWTTVVLGTPALAADAHDVKAHLEGLSAPSWSLSRILLCPRQTTAGTLDDEGLEQALRSTLQTLFLSGARDDDRVRAALGHRGEPAQVTLVSVAMADLPLARIRRYARWRLALTGLEALSEQADRPTTDPTRSDALRQQLAPDDLLADFSTGKPADEVRARAAHISGAEDSLPDNVSVALTDRSADLHARFRVLFEPIAKPWSRRIDPTHHPDHQAMLRLLDRVESDTLSAIDRRLAGLLDEELDPSAALRVLPALEHALQQVAHTLDEELAIPPEPLPSPEPPPPPDDPGLEELTRVIDGRPGIAVTWPILLALSACTGGLTVLTLTWLAGPAQAGTVSSTSVQPTPPEAWAVGFLVGLVVATVWQIAVLWSWKLAAYRVLDRRNHELAAAWALGGAGQEREQAERLLRVRRRRTADDLRRRYRQVLERLRALRGAIRQTTDEARTALADLRVRVGATPRQDDLTGLVGKDTALHVPLVEGGELAERLDHLGLHRDLPAWSARILQSTWPTRRGLMEDLPCLDTDRLLAEADALLGSPDARALLGDPATAQPRLHHFLRRAVPALAWGVEPLDAHGMPVRGRGRDRRLLIAPATLRATLEGAMADSPVHLEPTWTDSRVPWVSVLSLWDGHTIADVLRGMEAR